MKDKIIFFILGAVSGSAVTFFVTKKHYEKEIKKKINLEVDNRVNAEMAAMKKADKEKETSDDILSLKGLKSPTEKPNFMKYYDEVSEKHNYKNYSDVDDKVEEVKEETKAEEVSVNDIVIVSAAEIPYGIESEIRQFKYWADETITDEYNKPMSDEEIEATCGYGFADFFGADEEDPDIVYVKRGDQYFEISMDTRNYEDLQ